ncbi:MAG: nucleoside-diphosphate sugar epimerase/dehydratase [Myxococcota bacterium]
MIGFLRLPFAALRGRGSRRAAKLGLDICVFALAISVAYVVRFERWPTGAYGVQLPLLLIALPLMRFGAGNAFGTQRTSWRLFGLADALRLAASILVVSGVLVVARVLMPWLAPELTVVPLGVIVLDGFFALSGTIGVRVATRIIDEYSDRADASPSEAGSTRRALLVGAGRAGAMAARELRQRPDAGYTPVAFIDDDPGRIGLSVEGVAVRGTTADIASVARAVGAQTVILTMPSAPVETLRAIVERCRAARIPVQTVPGLYELLSGKVGITKVRPIRIEDLLGRGVVPYDDSIRDMLTGAFEGRCIVVTGAGGSIGSELCRQLAEQRPATLVLVEASENNLFDIEQELRPVLGDRLVPCLVDVRSEADVGQLFADHRPDVVFHAAAYKHVPMMEAHPAAAIDNNVSGTRVLAEAAHRNGVDRFLLVSTDKAVNATSIMGASKRVAEMVVHDMDQRSETRFCAVRFGNVLGSRGSVLHTFRRQIEAGGPVTVTHPDITRFFMTIPEAVRLLVQACAMGEGGEIFLLDMGEPVKILDMAHEMIRLAGFEREEVGVEIIGLRPGEKMHEELLRYGEDAQPSAAAGIMLATTATVDRVDLAPWIHRLERAARDSDVAMIRQMLATGAGYRDVAVHPRAAASQLGTRTAS